MTSIRDPITIGRMRLPQPIAMLLMTRSRALERWRTASPLNEPDPATFYTGGAHGCTDYPTRANTEEQAS